MRAVLVTTILIIVAVGITSAVGHWRWERSTAALVAGLEASPAPFAAESSQTTTDLPAPVQRYLTLAAGQRPPRVRAVRVRHVGEFKAGDGPEAWRPFTSTQEVRTDPPGFVWDAKVAMFPLVPVRVHDAYVQRRGLLEARVAGLVPVMRAEPTPDLDAGELLRWLAEAAWYPTALRPRPGLTWSAIDDSTARVTLQDGPVTVALTVHFGADGLIARVRADARMRETPAGRVPSPWEGRFWDYQRRDGFLVPLQGEVAWLLPDGPAPYWRGRIVALRYDAAP